MHLSRDRQLGRLLKGVDTGDYSFILAPKFLHVAARFRLIGSNGRQTEFVAQLFIPLIDKGRHCQNQETLDHAACEQFFKNQTCLNGLAQPDFVGK